MARVKRAGSGLLVIAAATAAATAAAAAAFSLSAAPAMAATTLTAKVSGGGSITATASKAVLTAVSNGATITCTSAKKTNASVASATVKTGSYEGSSPLKVGTTSKLSVNRCTGFLGEVRFDPKTLPYSIKIDSTTSSKGITDGIIGPIKVAVSMTACSFTMTGTAPGYFDNANHTLVVTPKLLVKPLSTAQLTVSGVIGCEGVFSNGGHVTYAATYSIDKKISIKAT
jgi:hypothetical protein